MEAGKAVLCEKPVALDAGQMRDMAACAARNGTFFMEAMWTRFFPVNQRIHEILSSGALCAITLLEADFGFGSWSGGKVANPTYQQIDISDIDLRIACEMCIRDSVYCVSYATWMKGALPVQIKALDSKVETGVDGMTAMLFRYADGGLAVLRSCIVQNTRQGATLYCEKGTVEIPDFWHPSRAVIRYREAGRADETIEMPYDADGATGFQFEAEAVMKCLDQGLTESPVLTWQQSIDIMMLLDGIREETGLSVPTEMPGT